MPEKELKTSLKQRIFIIVIAVILLGSTIAAYVATVVIGDLQKTPAKINNEELTALEEEYSAKQGEINDYGNELSKKYFDTMKSYTSRVKAYNATSINNDGLKTKDLKEGTGRELKDGDTDYFAYYIGWCADESVFDSSFNDEDNPTSLNAPLSASVGLIEGWDQGVIGMKIGGVRELSIPGELAYGDTQEICGGKNSPLKFVVMAIDDDKLSTLNSELSEISSKINEVYYGSANN